MQEHSGWVFYTKKIQDFITEPKFACCLHSRDGLLFVKGKEGSLEEESLVCFYLLVDPLDGTIVEVSYQIFGSPLLIALSEALCELILKKNYLQASRIGAELLEKKLRDFPHQEAISHQDRGQVNRVLSALYEALGSCKDIVIIDPYAHSPLSEEGTTKNSFDHSAYWPAYSLEEKLDVIKKVIKEEIEPYIALDEGGVEVKELLNDKEVIIIYQGSCTSCFSAIGATLNAIDQILKQKVHPQIFVTPDTSVLSL